MRYIGANAVVQTMKRFENVLRTETIDGVQEDDRLKDTIQEAISGYWHPRSSCSVSQYERQ